MRGSDCVLPAGREYRKDQPVAWIPSGVVATATCEAHTISRWTCPFLLRETFQFASCRSVRDSITSSLGWLHNLHILPAQPLQWYGSELSGCVSCLHGSPARSASLWTRLTACIFMIVDVLCVQDVCIKPCLP